MGIKGRQGEGTGSALATGNKAMKMVPKKKAPGKMTITKKAGRKKTKKKASKKKGTRSRSQLDLFNAPAAKKTSTRKRKKKNSGGDVSQAELLARRQKDISVSEFFAKNRHLLGFDSPTRALLATVREAVDNSLDACEEAGILPEIIVEVVAVKANRFRVIVRDNGPGIVKEQLPKIFGRLLYGSKFHSRKQTRGQQGIGISAAGMYGTLTTGKPVRITSRTSAREPAYKVNLVIDLARNQPVVKREQEVDVDWKHGTQVEIDIEATYKKGKHSVDSFLEQVSLANPHVKITYMSPNSDEAIVFDRVVKSLPAEPKEILPHPHGVELGILMKMLKETSSRTVSGFLCSEFCRVTTNVVGKIADISEANGRRIDPDRHPKRLSNDDVALLHAAIGETRIMAPPTNCLSPIGEELIAKTLARNLNPELILSATRPPAVYRGNPFQVEAGIAWGGDFPGDELATIFRFANRVPLQFEQGACAMTSAVINVPWRNYQVQQARGALPTAPMAILIHIASVWVPFTSESKKAVAHYDEILKEMRLALMEVGRKLATHLRKRKRLADAERKRSYIEKYIPQIGIALQQILELSDQQRGKAEVKLADILERSRKL
ncbi:MAG TPA: DNA topoisomerase VI subunit B [Planctomycetes bacterium]|nr:DNA topoisomerase VI subunit B [Planctomycetota bacterium]